MDLATARQHIEACIDRMRLLYEAPVFDEWVLLAFGPPPQGGVLAYAGPRAESFRRQLPADAAPLRALVADRHLAVGDFDFALEASGTHYDALMRTGAASYLVCNHTGKSMTDIRANPRWLKAQAAFFELSEKFRDDPLTE
ncbi:MAG: hypothetical protein HZA31_13260 [Opitutae bacterium]|nr:hypothetical protein [Opitutae bacterium]